MSQLVSELKKCEEFRERGVKIVALTSRKGLCVHEKLKTMESSAMLTEKCEDLTEKGKCPYKDEQLLDILSANLL